MTWDDAASLVLRGMMPDLPADVAAEILAQAALVRDHAEAVAPDYLRQMTLLTLCAETAKQRLLWVMP